MIDLSIIIPVYKTEKYLRECVDSVIAAAPLNSEIILVDDSSPDNCPAICDEYKAKDERITVLHQQNGGVSVARNNGIKVARGERLFFLDSDDYLPEGYFDGINDFSADLVMTNYCAFYTDGKEIAGRKDSADYSSLRDFLLDFNEYFVLLFNCAWGKIYKTSIIKENGIIFENCAMAEDALFNAEYYSHCKSIRYLSDKKVYYRQIGGSLSHTLNPRLYYIYKDAYGRIEKLLKNDDAFTDKNQEHFYSCYFGDITESLAGAVVSKEKYKIVSEMCHDKSVQKATAYNKTRWLNGVVKAINKKNAKAVVFRFKKYLFLLKVKRFLRAIKVVR